MEIFFLRYVNETIYLLWNLPFFKMAPPKTNFFSFPKPWVDFISIVLWLGAILSQKCILWERSLVKLPQP